MLKRTQEVNEKYLKKIYLNLLKAIVIIVYFLSLNIAYSSNIQSKYMELAIEIVTMIFLLISIYIFEKAYKKDDGNLAIQGIEVLILSVYTLTAEHITTKFNFNIKSYSLLVAYIYSIYFVLKSIIIYTNGRKEMVKSLSDIREIVQKEEPKKKEATKKNTKENIQPNIEKSAQQKSSTKIKKNTEINKDKNKKNQDVTNVVKKKKSTTTTKGKTKEKEDEKEIKKEIKNTKNEKVTEEKTKSKRVKKEVEKND